MKKETVFVRTKNRNQANMYAEILKKTGETIRPDFNSNTSLNDPDLDYRDSGWILGFSTHGKQEITFGQLIDLLNEPQKIAVHVENEKEFKALMKYYDSMGWKTFHDLSVSQVVNVWSSFKFPQSVTYCDGFSSYQKNQLYSDDYQIIPFSEFAAEYNIKLPLLTSEDGVDLYEGSEFWTIDKKYLKIINANGRHKLDHDSIVITAPNRYTSFFAHGAALDWIEAQKPKQIEVEIGERDLKAIIFKDGSDCISFKQRSKMVNIAHLTFKEIRDIKDAMANI